MMTTIRHWLDKLRPHSLRSQLVTRTMIILALLLLLIGMIQYVVLQQFLYRSQIDSLNSRIRAIPHVTWLKIISGEVRDARTLLSSFQERGVAIAFIDTTGELYPIMVSPQFGDDASLDDVIHLSPLQYTEAMKSRKNSRDYKIVQSSNHRKQLVVLSPIGGKNHTLGLIQVTYDVEMIGRTLSRALWTFLIGSLLALVAGFITYLVTIRRTLGPLSLMIEHVKQTDAGSLNRQMHEQTGQEELNNLALSYNAMLQRIEASFAAEKEARESMRRFVADASHELRTPLTSIHGFLEVILRGAAKKPEQLEQAIKSMYRESERINKLVHDLLLLAKFDRKPLLMMKPVHLGEMILEMESQFKILAENRQVIIEIRDDLQVNADVDRIKQVVLNLFHNAVQHTDPIAGVIHIFIDSDEKYAMLKVQDNGHGIDAEHLPHIFDRFYREESSRTRQSGGAGLGLSIASSIIELHQGHIDVTSEVNVGSIFTMKLPR
jgi:two-component system OmpR family sensor kinase